MTAILPDANDLRSEIVIAMGAIINIPLNGVRCYRGSVSVSFKLPNFAAPVILHIWLPTQTSTWSLGCKNIMGPLPWSCERTDIWEELFDFSIMGKESENLIRAGAEQCGGRVWEKFRYSPVGPGRTLVRIELEGICKQDYWIEVDCDEDADSLGDQFFACERPDLLLGKWATLGWRKSSGRSR